MKRLIVYVFIVSLYLSSCTKEKQADEVTYEVSLISSTSWHGAYLDKDASVVGITSAPNNWRYSFKNDNDLTVVTLQAYPDGTNPAADALMKIYVNGRVVVEGRSSIFPQVQYQFP